MRGGKSLVRCRADPDSRDLDRRNRDNLNPDNQAGARGCRARCGAVRWLVAGPGSAARRIGAGSSAAGLYALRALNEMQRRSADRKPRPQAHKRLRLPQPWPRGRFVPHCVLQSSFLSRSLVAGESVSPRFRRCWRATPTGRAVGRCCPWFAGHAPQRPAREGPAAVPSR